MHINRARFTDKVRAPNTLQELFPCKGKAEILHKLLEQLIFLQRQRDTLSGNLHRMLTHIHGQLTHAQRPCLFLRCGPAQHRLHTADHLHHAEGLGKIIIRAQIKTEYLVIFRPSGGGQNNGNVRRGCLTADLFQNRNAVLAGQHQIKHNQFRRLFGKCRPKRGALGKALCLKSRRGQGIQHQIADGGVIFHTKDHRITPSVKVKSPVYGFIISRGYKICYRVYVKFM